MKKILVLVLMSLMLCTFAGCKKDEAAKTDDAAAAAAPAAEANAAAPAADAKADDKAAPAAAPAAAAPAAAPEADANADAPKANADVDAVAKTLNPASAAKIMADFFSGLDAIAKDAAGDCDKLGDGLGKHLESSTVNLAAAFKYMASVGEESAEAKEMEKLLENAAQPSEEFTKLQETCQDNEKVQGFAFGLLAVMMSAGADEAGDAGAAEAAAPEAAAQAAE